MLITVIVPVFKVEKYIGPCIQSILRQTFRDFDIIVMNDGSPDRSAEIAERLLSEQSEIPYRIVTTENRGVSAARNTGLKFAQGKYVVMVDADDVLACDFLMDFTEQIKQFPDAHIFSCSFSVVDEEHTAAFDGDKGGSECLCYQDAQLAFFERRIKFLLPALLLRASFLRENNIRFDEAVRYSEDVQFIWRCLAYNRQPVIHSWAKNYNYILHPGSTMTASGIENILTFCGGVERLEKETQEFFCNPIRSQLKARMYFSMIHGTAKMLSYQNFKTLYERSDCKRYITKQLHEGEMLPRAVSLILILSKRLGYEVMRRF